MRVSPTSARVDLCIVVKCCLGIVLCVGTQNPSDALYILNLMSGDRSGVGAQNPIEPLYRFYLFSGDRFLFGTQNPPPLHDNTCGFQATVFRFGTQNPNDPLHTFYVAPVCRFLFRPTAPIPTPYTNELWIPMYRIRSGAQLPNEP